MSFFFFFTVFWPPFLPPCSVKENTFRLFFSPKGQHVAHAIVNFSFSVKPIAQLGGSFLFSPRHVQ